jgi:hypothetical protein
MPSGSLGRSLRTTWISVTSLSARGTLPPRRALRSAEAQRLRLCVSVRACLCGAGWVLPLTRSLCRSGLGGGAIAGIVIGVLLGLLLIGFLVWFFVLRPKQNAQAAKAAEPAIPMPATQKSAAPTAPPVYTPAVAKPTSETESFLAGQTALKVPNTGAAAIRTETPQPPPPTEPNPRPNISKTAEQARQGMVSSAASGKRGSVDGVGVPPTFVEGTTLSSSPQPIETKYGVDATVLKE